MSFQIVNPDGLASPRGYNHGLLAPAGSRVLFVAGQIGWDANRMLVDGGLVAQFEQALANVLAVLREAGGTPEHVGRMTVYVTDVAAYRGSLEVLGHIWRRHMGRHYPAMAVVGVAALLEHGAVVEIEATAVLAGGSIEGR